MESAMVFVGLLIINSSASWMGVLSFSDLVSCMWGWMEETELGFDVEAGVPLLIDQAGDEDDDNSSNEEEEEDLLSNGGLLVPNEDADEDDVAVESLDYDSIHNLVHEQLLTKQHRHSHRRLYGSELLSPECYWSLQLIYLHPPAKYRIAFVFN